MRASLRSVTYWLTAYRSAPRRQLDATALAPKINRGRVALLSKLTCERFLAEVDLDTMALG